MKDDGKPEQQTAKIPVVDSDAVRDFPEALNKAQPDSQKPPAPDLVHDPGDIPAISGYLWRIGATAKSFRHAVIEEQQGRYRKILHTIRFDERGIVSAPDELMPSEAEQQEISAAWHLVPTYQPAFHLDDLPAYVTSGKHWIFMDEKNDKILMVQSRVDKLDDKNYYIWTQWSDDEWRPLEPPGKLPLYNLPALKNILQQSFMKAVKVLPYGGS